MKLYIFLVLLLMLSFSSFAMMVDKKSKPVDGNLRDNVKLEQGSELILKQYLKKNKKPFPVMLNFICDVKKNKNGRYCSLSEVK